MAKALRVLLTFPLLDAGREKLKQYASTFGWEIIQPADVNTSMTQDEVLAHARQGIDGLLCAMLVPVNDALLDAAGNCIGKRLKVISTMTVGYDHIDVEAVKLRGIPIGYTPDVLTDATADITVMLTLAACRRMIAGVDRVRNGQWAGWNPREHLGTDLRGKTLGVLGMGRIGLATALRLRAFGMQRVIYHSRSPKSAAAQQVNADYVSFETLLRESDVLCICCSLNPQTHHLLDYEAFCQMKRTAVLVNTARGGIIQQEDLVRALQEGQIAAAGLDVTTPEPLPATHPLVHLPNCIVLPHIGSATQETRNAMAMLAVENLKAGLTGESLPARIE